MSTYLTEAMEKWAPVLDDESSGAAKLTGERRRVTAIVMETTIREQAKAAQATQGFINESMPSSSTGNVANFDPVIAGLLRRAMPKLIAYDFCGVQPMTMPTGLIFAARNRYTSASGAEALFNEADSGFSTGAGLNATPGTNPVSTGTGVHGLSPWDSTPGFANPTGVTTAQGEDFGGA